MGFVQLWDQLGGKKFRLDFLFDVADDKRVFVFQEFGCGEDFVSDLGVLSGDGFFMMD